MGSHEAEWRGVPYLSIALMTAMMMPTDARKREKMLISPPRTLGDRATRNPITPNIIAMMARMIPVPGLTHKLAMADPMAMIEGILKWGLFCASAGFICHLSKFLQHSEDRK